MPTEHGSVRVVSGGDVMFETPLSQTRSASCRAVQDALAYLTAADLCFMNCEMPLTRRGQRVEKTASLRSDPIVASDLARLGIDVVTLANNHMLDYGYDGLFDTLSTIDSVGIGRVGAGATREEALRPHYVSVNGRRLALFGVAATLPPGFAAGVDRPGIAPIRVTFSFAVDPNLMAEQPGTAPWVHTQAVIEDVEQIADLIRRAKQEADYVIVAVHWGLTRRRATPYQGMIADYQGPLGRAFIDAGADMILGNHSHNLHGVEVYQGKPIFYSLGNFIFHHPRDYMEPESVIVAADLNGSTLHIELVPVLVNDEGFPEVARGDKREHVLGVLAERSAQFGTEFLPTANGVAVRLG